MTPKGYTNIEQIEAYLLIDVKQYFESQVNTWIAQVESFIDRVTGRNFIADAAASKRYFDGDNSRTLLLDDFVALTEIKLGNDAEDTSFNTSDLRTEYLLYPSNALVNKAPYWEIRLKNNVFPRGDQNIEVTAKWGYSVEVPPDIQLVATMLVSDIIEESAPLEGEVQSMTIGRYSVTYKTEERWQSMPEVKAMIENYRKLKNF